jgi:hypothetical protein
MMLYIYLLTTIVSAYIAIFKMNLENKYVKDVKFFLHL